MKKYINTITEFPFSVKLFLITEMIFGLSMGIWFVTMNFHLKFNGFTNQQVGGLLAIGLIMTALFSLVAGEVCNRVGFKKAMLFGCGLKGMGMMIVALMPTYFPILIGLFIISIGDSLVLSSEYPYLLGLTEEKHRSTVYSLLIASFLLAMFVGNIAGGYLPNVIKTSQPYFLTVLLSACLFIALGLSRLKLPEINVEKKYSKLFLYMLREPKIMLFAIYSVIWGVVFNIALSLPNILFREQFNLLDKEVGILFSATTIIGCISAFVVPLILAKLRHTTVAMTVQLLSVLSFLVLAVSTFKVFVFFWLIAAFLRIMMPGTVDSAMLQTVPVEQQGGYSGIKVCANNMGASAGAYIAGTILMFSNYSTLMLAAAFLAAVQYTIYTFGCRRFL